MLSPDPPPYKTTLPAQALPRLSGFGLLAVDGPQAGAFLQAQAMNDVASLGVGEWQWNGWLSAKGRVLALFALLRTGEDAFRLVLPDMPAGELRDALSRYVFRSKVRLGEDPALACAAELAPPVVEGAAPAHVATRCEEGWSLDFGGDGGARRLWLLPGARCAEPAPEVDAAWRRADLRHGLPRLGPAQREAWTPQMLSLERLRAFSVKKGCYPGQEVVARTHFLGQAKRGLALLEGEGLREGATLAGAGSDTAVGTVVCTADDDRLALAVVSGTADQSLFMDGHALERRPLAGGLQRPA